MKKPAIAFSLGLLSLLTGAASGIAEDMAAAPLSMMEAATCEGAALPTSPEAAVPAALAGAIEAQAGTCCAQKFAACARECGACGVESFNCTLDFPGCKATCTCNACG
ncbi:MAG TPA: hypothetical protein VF756_11970 [Thermoanaerobaculia bacterium]